MSRPIIEVDHLSKRYRLGAIGSTSLRDTFNGWCDRLRQRASRSAAKDFWALRDVSFSLQAGEVTGIIGGNGAGKSTLLKILSRITTPTHGRAVLRGRVASLLEVGTGFHPDLTGRENVFLNGAILGMSRAEIRLKFDEIVAFAEVEQFIDTPVKRYSSGMYVRLAFAVAAHLEPEILIVDEVLAVGDMQFQKKCLGKLQQVSQDDGRTVLFVSHNLGVVANLCQRVLLLRRGVLIDQGAPSRVISKYIEVQATQQGEVFWHEQPFSKNERMALRAARTLVRQKIAGDVAIDQPLCLELDVEVFQRTENFASSIHLFDKQGVWVLCSNVKSATVAPGRYRHRYHFPADFFNDGHYHFNVVLLRNATQHEVSVPEAIAFTVHETGAGREEYGGVINGCIRPRLLTESAPLP